MKLGLSSTFSWIWANTDSITKWIQVLALVVAGYWTYIRFIRVDAPSLQPIARVEFKNFDLTTRDDGLCELNMKVFIHNDGHTSFDIGRIQVQGWQSAVPQPTAESPAYFDVKKMREGVPVLNADSLPDSFLNKHYPPGSQYDQNFVWKFKRINPLWMFELTIYDNKNNRLEGVRQWGTNTCGK